VISVVGDVDFMAVGAGNEWKAVFKFVRHQYEAEELATSLQLAEKLVECIKYQQELSTFQEAQEIAHQATLGAYIVIRRKMEVIYTFFCHFSPAAK